MRIDWKTKYPDTVFIYFNCKTTLAETFREVFEWHFTFNGNRVIMLPKNENISFTILNQCILASLRYRKIKRLSMFGF